MEISFTLAESILKTLPVGYYLRHNCSVKLTNEDATYANIVDETICISYPMIADAAKDLPATTDLQIIENDIRCLLYHEISHLILTPLEIVSAIHAYTRKLGMPEIKDIFNIFEDERIETVLAKYYMNVDFKKFCFRLNRYNPLDMPTDPMQKFFKVVRFRNGTPEQLDKVTTIIKKYGTINCGSCHTWEYLDDILALWKMINGDTSKKSDTPEEPKKSDTPETSEHGSPAPSKSTASGDTSEKSDTGVIAAGDMEVPEEIKKAIEEVLATISPKDFEKMLKKACDNLFDTKPDPEFEHNLNAIFVRALNRKAFRSTACNGYAGKIDPRSCGRDDYRWFVKPSDRGAISRFDKVKLNLFIDCSGSFRRSEPVINNLLVLLRNIEKQNKNFEFDVVAMGDSDRLLPKTDRAIHCTEGNALNEDIFDCWKKVQTASAVNYNIAVWDGDAQSMDSPGYSKSDRKRLRYCFGAFNHGNVAIISDPSNQDHIEKYCPQAKKIFCNDDYAEKFNENVITILNQIIK